jgi:hypothetical protein
VIHAPTHVGFTDICGSARFSFALRRDVGYVILESRIFVLSEIFWALARLSHRAPLHRNDPGHRGFSYRFLVEMLDFDADVQHH